MGGSEDSEISWSGKLELLEFEARRGFFVSIFSIKSSAFEACL